MDARSEIAPIIRLKCSQKLSHEKYLNPYFFIQIWYLNFALAVNGKEISMNLNFGRVI